MNIFGGMNFSNIVLFAPFDDPRASTADPARQRHISVDGSLALMGGKYRSSNKMLPPLLYYKDATEPCEQYVKLSYMQAFREYRLATKKSLIPPTLKFSDIAGLLPYDEVGNNDPNNYNVFNWFLRSEKGIHQGQRKLLDTEIQALNTITTSSNDVVIIFYAGSAPSMKLWFISTLYPNAIFVLIDPNEFFLYVHRYDLPHYVFNDRDYVANGYKWGGPSDEAERKIESERCIYLSVSKSNMYESRIYKRKNVVYYDPGQGDSQRANHLVHMTKPFTDSGLGKSQRNINNHSGEFDLLTKRAGRESIEYVFANAQKLINGNDTNQRFYFIEEYMTNHLADIIGEVGAKYPNIKTMFWSDIRTNLESGNAPGMSPTDLDVMLNTAWTYSWLRRMKPTISMLKWRLPFFNESTEVDFSGFAESFDDAAAQGYDFRVPTWKDGKFAFFPGDIMLQPWCGPNSTETRLIVKRDDIVKNNLHEYIMSEYEGKLNWYNNVDRFSMFHINNNADPEIGFCHCNDCAIENSVWEEYRKRNPNCDIKELITKLSSLLNISLINRGGRFGHGHLFPSITMADFVTKVNESNYTEQRPIRYVGSGYDRDSDDY